MYSIAYTNGEDERFIGLCHLLDGFLTRMIGEDTQNNVYAQYNSLHDIHDVILILDDGKAVACGSFKQFDCNSVEMKRVFVKEEYRKNGLGHIIVDKLESIAKDRGASKMILETGRTMTPAINLYKSCGFEMTNNFGEYKDIDTSVCMCKSI